MHRREFLIRSTAAVGASWLVSKQLGSSNILAALADTKLPTRFSASDTVTLGSTGIKTSRLAMGTGTVGSGHHSNQTALGVKGLSDLLLNGYDHGLRFFDAADSYGSHPHVAEALKHVPRDKVTVLTKTWARDPATARADLDRFRRELGTDYLDICMMHCLTEADWTTRYRGVMDVFEDAKQKGIIRAHGCSCHSIEALLAAAKSPWVEVDFARINPIGSHMDDDPQTVVSVLREMKSAGKAVVGMKILGQGDLAHRQSEALKYA
ncbi:MAG: aldo/keto reductase, partial [Candidatus Sulfotelmatobacter sp.]